VPQIAEPKMFFDSCPFNCRVVRLANTSNRPVLAIAYREDKLALRFSCPPIEELEDLFSHRDVSARCSCFAKRIEDCARREIQIFNSNAERLFGTRACIENDLRNIA
jgi:hypothetical protein